MADEDFVMPVYDVPGIDYVEKPLTQPQKRRHHTLTDQYGRMYECTLDTTSKPHMAPVGPITPLGWSDPLNTPEQYKSYGKATVSDAKGANFFRVYIEVEQWERDALDRLAEYEATVIATAAAMSPKDGGAALLGEGPHDRSPHLLTAVGPKPQPVEFVQALIAGNKWARGETTKVPEWARKLMPIKIVPAAQETDLEKLRAKFPDADDDVAADPKRAQQLESLAKAREARHARKRDAEPSEVSA